MRFFLLVGSLFFIGALSAHAQTAPTLHVAVLEQESFVAVGGEKDGAAGLFRRVADTTWTHLGWANTRNFGLDAIPSEPGSIFLACGNGVLRTLDNGASWKVTTDWKMTEVLDVAVDPNAQTHVYAATAYGVWRSPDKGATWTEINSGIPSPRSTFTQTIAVDRQQAGRLIVGSEGGLFLTTSGGTEWTSVGPEEIAIRDVTQSEADPQLWFAGTEENGVVRSQDGGKTWSFVDGEEMKTIYAVDVDPLDADHVAAAGFEGGVYVSEDGGETWRQVGLGDHRVHALAFDPREPGRLWAGTLGEGVFYTGSHQDWRYGGLDGAVIRGMEFFDVPSTNNGADDAS